MRIQAKIQKWGNSLALRLTGPMKSVPQFEQDMLVDVEVTEKWIKVAPVRPKLKVPYSEAELLADLSPEGAHADEIATINDKEFGS